MKKFLFFIMLILIFSLVYAENEFDMSKLENPDDWEYDDDNPNYMQSKSNPNFVVAREPSSGNYVFYVLNDQGGIKSFGDIRDDFKNLDASSESINYELDVKYKPTKDSDFISDVKSYDLSTTDLSLTSTLQGTGDVEELNYYDSYKHSNTVKVNGGYVEDNIGGNVVAIPIASSSYDPITFMKNVNTKIDSMVENGELTHEAANQLYIAEPESANLQFNTFTSSYKEKDGSLDPNNLNYVEEDYIFSYFDQAVNDQSDIPQYTAKIVDASGLQIGTAVLKKSSSGTCWSTEDGCVENTIIEVNGKYYAYGDDSDSLLEGSEKSVGTTLENAGALVSDTEDINSELYNLNIDDPILDDILNEGMSSEDNDLDELSMSLKVNSDMINNNGYAIKNADSCDWG